MTGRSPAIGSRTFWPAVTLVALSLLVSRPAEAASASRVEDHVASLVAGGRFEIDSTIGRIDIAGDGIDEVRIRAEVEVKDAKTPGDADRRLEEIEVRVEQTPGAVYVRTVVPGGFLDDMDEEYEVRYSVAVPHHVQIDAELDVGQIKVQQVSGRIAVETHVGEIDVHVVNGSIDAQANVGAVRAELEGFDGNGRLRFHTNVGNVEVRLPADLAADLDASVNVGNVSCEFDVESERAAWIGERVTGPINGGGPTLKARANIGDVRIRKR